jgi:alpha-N-arabinofuranosidase
MCSLISLAALLFVGQTTASQQHVNHAPNSSFELASAEKPIGWSTQTWGGEASFTLADNGHTGGKSVQISSADGADSAWTAVVPVKLFSKYRLSGWIKTKILQTTTGRGAQLNLHAMQGLRTRALKGTNDWTKVVMEFESGLNESVQINCLFGGWGLATGTAWFDDISLELLETKEMNVSISIDADKKQEPISPYIYGQFIEHLGRCIYGGIWAEMLEDRKFYYAVGHEESPWTATNQTVAMDTKNPYVGDQTPILPTGSGVSQGELGLIEDRAYVGRIVLAGTGSVEVIFDWGSGIDMVVVNAREEFTKHPFKFKSGATTDQGRLTVKSNGSIRLGTISLMPTDNIRGMRADTVKLLKELDSPVYRWPGGNFVSGYDWRDGIGDPDRRPPRKNPAWTGVEYNDFGLHEFIDFCREINTEPFIAVNTGLGTPEEAAEEVAYCNSPATSLLGKQRASNGDEEPFNVKFWAADHMESISEHIYWQERTGVMSHVSQAPQSIKRIVDAHRTYREEIGALDGKDIRIALDEWNYWYGPHLYGELGTRYFLKDALGVAAGLHELFRSSDMVFMANYAQTVNVIGAIKTTKTAAEFATTGQVLKLYRQKFGTIPVEVAGEFGVLDVAAAVTQDGKKLTVAIVNPTASPVDVPLEIKGVEFGSDGGAWIISGPDAMSFNEPGVEPAVVIEQAQVSLRSGKVAAPALSIMLIELDRK